MVTKDLGMVTAYAYAVAGGYTGTEAQFEQLMADLAIVVDDFDNFSVTVTTLPAGSSATASYSNGVLSLGIPKGDKGDTGNTGATGATPQLSIGTVETTAEPSVTITGTVDNPVLNFGLVKGDKGDTGEVSEAELTQAFEDFSESGTVANAEQLVSTVRAEDKTPYLFRTSGGSVDIGNREHINGIVGGTVAWNQLVNSGDTSVTVTSGHKYYSNINNVKTIGSSNGSAISINDSTKDNVHDLTLLFGSTIADYIYSLEQATAGSGVQWLKSHGFMTKPYYAYNAGELKSVSGLVSHDMVGFNAWDEEWESGLIDVTNGINGADPDCIRSENYIRVVPSATYYVFKDASLNFGNIRICRYDANKNFIDSPDSLANATIVMTENTHYVRFYTRKTSGTATYSSGICINLSWDGSRDGEYEPYQKWSYPLDSDLELRGVPKLDANNNLYYDGDVYEADGTVTRYWGERAYQNGDASDFSTMITDGTTTIYKLSTPTTESADPYTSPQIVSDFGTEEYVLSAGAFPMPAGHDTEYPVDLKAKLEMAPNSPDQGNGDYIVRHTNGTNEYVPLVIEDVLPQAPSSNGTYSLTLTVANGEVTLSWT